MARAIYWEHPNMQINVWDEVVKSHYYTIAVVQLYGYIISSEVHCCKWRLMGAHCANGWEGALGVLYLELKVTVVLKFNTPSQAKLELKVEIVLEFDAFS
jgi:hypothetical protein